MVVFPKPAPVASPGVGATVTPGGLGGDHVGEAGQAEVLRAGKVAIAEYCRRPPLASGTMSSALVDCTASDVTTGRNVTATVRFRVSVTEQFVPDVVEQPFQPMNS